MNCQSLFTQLQTLQKEVVTLKSLIRDQRIIERPRGLGANEREVKRAQWTNDLKALESVYATLKKTHEELNISFGQEREAFYVESLEESLNLKEQFETQVRLQMKKKGLVRIPIDENDLSKGFHNIPGEVGYLEERTPEHYTFKAVDDKEYTFTYKDVLTHLLKKYEEDPELKVRLEKHGFSRMLIVPQVDIMQTAALTEHTLITQQEAGKLYRGGKDLTTPGEKITNSVPSQKTQRGVFFTSELLGGQTNEEGGKEIDVKNLLFEHSGWEDDGNGKPKQDQDNNYVRKIKDAQGNTHDPKTKRRYAGYTQKELLTENLTSLPGLDIYFVEEDFTIPASDAPASETVRNGFSRLKAGLSPHMYMQKLQELNKGKKHELKGMPINSWLTYAALVAQEYGQVLDDYSSNGKANFSMGNVFEKSGCVPDCNWNAHSCQMRVLDDFPMNASAYGGVRPAVKV